MSSSVGVVSLKKIVLGAVMFVLIVCGVGYMYLVNSIHDPFTIDGAMTMTESSAAQFVGTNQTYNFRLINVSDRNLRLDGMKLQGYSGIRVGQLNINGKPARGQSIPSDKRGTGTSWEATSHHTVDYRVHIESNTIQSPRSVRITYSYLGFKHTQTVRLPGTHF